MILRKTIYYQEINRFIETEVILYDSPNITKRCDKVDTANLSVLVAKE